MVYKIFLIFYLCYYIRAIKTWRRAQTKDSIFKCGSKPFYTEPQWIKKLKYTWILRGCQLFKSASHHIPLPLLIGSVLMHGVFFIPKCLDHQLFISVNEYWKHWKFRDLSYDIFWWWLEARHRRLYLEYLKNFEIISASWKICRSEELQFIPSCFSKPKLTF